MTRWLTAAHAATHTPADGVELTAEQVEKLDNLTPAAGGHHNESQMALIER